MIDQAVKIWYEATSGRLGKPLGLVLHTSCVNYDLGRLQALAQLPIRWILLEDVWWELRLLQQSRIYGRQAALILERAGRMPSGAWHLEQLYRTCKAPITPGSIFSGTLLFAFGDLNKLDEFLAHVIPMKGHHVLLNSGWNCGKDHAVVYPLEKARGLQIRKVRPLTGSKAVLPLSALKRIECAQTSQRLKGSDFHFTGKNGSNARIYTCDAFPREYVKIYNQGTMVGSSAQKLEKLTTLRKLVGNMPLALPEKLLTVENDQIIGYTMMPCRGRPLREYIYNGWDGCDLKAVFRNLVLMLLELHCMHIHVNDLSYNNVLVGEDGSISLVDCDSFQVFHFPGGPITQIYRHPEILEEHCQDTLREPRHEYFAFAVLVFQCLFYGDPLQQVQRAEDDRELSWDYMQFPLDVGRRTARANATIQRLWDRQDEAVKTVFADEFHFRSDNSLGVWIKALGLLS